MANVTIYLQLTDDPSAQVLTCEEGASFGLVHLGQNHFHLPLFVPEASAYARKVAAAFIEAADELDRRDALNQPSPSAAVTPATTSVISAEDIL